MPEIYLPLEEAAALEKLSYTGFASRVQRNPRQYNTQLVTREAGGKVRVNVALSSLSPKARRGYLANAKRSIGTEAIIEENAQEEPWYLDVDLNWYMETNKQRYYEAVALSREVGRFLAYSEGERTAHAEEVAAQLGISARTLYRYSEAYLGGAAWALKMEQEEARGFDYFKILALCRKPRESKTFPSLTPDLRAVIENIWFDKGFAENHGTVEMLYWKLGQLAKERGWESVPSYQTIRRYICHLMSERGSKSARFLAANGQREWRNQQMLKAKRDIAALQVMEMVQGDEHTLDMWVSYTYPNGKIKAVRPKLVAWIDTRSRAILGDVMCVDANAQILKESLVKMMYSHPGGVPKHIHIDNGKDYTAQTNTGQSRKERTFLLDAETEGFYRSIGIQEWSRSLPYQPWGKGQIERFFGTVCLQFSRWFASYVGTLTGSKTTGKRKKDVPAMLERGELLTMEELYAFWTKWKNEFYHQREHSSLRQDGEQYVTPLSLFENGERYYKAAPPREYAAMLLMKGDTAHVRNQGILKWGTLYTDYELCHHIGERVNIKWDVDNATKLYVYAQDGRKICEAESAELLKFSPGISQTALEEHIKNQKRQERETKDLLESYRTPYELRAQDEGQSTPVVVGGLDLTIKADHSEKVIQLPQDKEYRSTKKTAKESDNSYYNQKAQSTLEKLRELG